MRVVPDAAAAELTRDRVELLGTQVDRVPRDAMDAWIMAFIESGQPHQIVTANLDFIAVARKRPQFAKVIEEAALVVCDGKPLQWAARLQGSPIPARVTGMDLVLHAAKLSAARGYRLFLLGAAPGVCLVVMTRSGLCRPRSATVSFPISGWPSRNSSRRSKTRSVPTSS